MRIAGATIAWLIAAGSAGAQPQPAPARPDAGGGTIHVVRQGETLASIAQRYYGDPRRESVLVAENGLTAQGGAAIVVGLRLIVPWVTYHRVAEGETWIGLAARFYGDGRRAHVLIEANSSAGGQTPGAPNVGAELLIPYPVRHVAGQHDTVMRISQLYYGSTDAVRKLRRFNFIRGSRLQRGQIVLVPLPDLTLSAEGRRMLEQQTRGPAPAGGEVRQLQASIDAQLPELREHVAEGRFTEAVGLANRLLGAGELTGNQIVTIQREAATAYVALGREDLAEHAFREALQRQPDLELDGIRTSPTVLRAFERARTRNRAQTQAGVDGGAAPDAGPRTIVRGGGARGGP